MVVDVMVVMDVSPLTGSVPRQNPVLPSRSSLPARGPTCLDRKWQLRTVLHRPTTTCCCRRVALLRSKRRPPPNNVGLDLKSKNPFSYFYFYFPSRREESRERERGE